MPDRAEWLYKPLLLGIIERENRNTSRRSIDPYRCEFMARCPYGLREFVGRKCYHMRLADVQNELLQL
ncbi:hypothetical protein DOTSEDRAFT_68387 [Dothistroma septosporum NZE10]|uniref:Uncharacterized protein n=1 Tax=Dothistroma septosporum (strain NZE10 / CBS 128990) TaxID=675120 RepID=N1Q4A2_DOTSN|nr:hypothetical protein DOTSEDRAFT_68387 [Dothistroma septosporum NZE10]